MLTEKAEVLGDLTIYISYSKNTEWQKHIGLIMTDFIHFQVEVDDGNNSSSDDDKRQDNEISLNYFIDNTNYEENLSNYYGFRNVSRSVESAKEDTFSAWDI